MIANVYVIGLCILYIALMLQMYHVLLCFAICLTRASRDDPPFISVENEANPLENNKLGVDERSTGEQSHIDCSQEGNHSINPLINNQYTPFSGVFCDSNVIDGSNHVL